MNHDIEFEFAKRMAKGLAGQFGQNCEVVIHDLRGNDLEHSIVAIENGHVTGRSIGDGPSHIVLESLKGDPKMLQDRISYLTRTSDGRVLKSTTLFIRDDEDRIIGLLGINYDISMLVSLEGSLRDFTGQDRLTSEPEAISRTVADLLDELLERSVSLVGKPTAMMSKDDKIRAIRFLDDNGAFLITKSGPKVCQYFGISTYTLYSYLDEIRKTSE
ncbi:MAG: helix-turn-helix transcriptional regulator [Mogibacterium sp.]|nr:helix-turn-helix transcriptional regulator [Mogibacterium sp.]